MAIDSNAKTCRSWFCVEKVSRGATGKVRGMASTDDVEELDGEEETDLKHEGEPSATSNEGNELDSDPNAALSRDAMISVAKKPRNKGSKSASSVSSAPKNAGKKGAVRNSSAS